MLSIPIVRYVYLFQNLINTFTGAKWIKGLTQNRLGQFLGGHYSDVNLSSLLFTQR